MKIEVSNGEIIDKYTILTIKLDKIKDSEKLVNIKKEHDYLLEVVDSIYTALPTEKANAELAFLHEDLLNVNKTLWNIEDFIRESERDETFGADFIELARSVYYTNDDRSEVKKSINILT